MEPMWAPAGVTDVQVRDGDQALREFYVAAYPRLVQLLTLVCGSRPEAEEVVQEAFVRLLPRWARVKDYDDPEAWVRLVAFRLASNRRRRGQYLIGALRRTDRLGPSPAPSSDQVDVLRALAVLPIKQRQVVVLHHLLDEPIEQIAAELGVAEGTVKSRLARARQALTPLLEVSEHA
jgi:RNA polymerase sigma-70 factor (ECF subfamily)